MFSGIITPVITALDSQGTLDFAGNKLVIDRLIKGGMTGLLFLGSMGEAFAMTQDEKKELIRFAVATVEKRVPVLIGTGGTVQEEVLDLTEFAAREGADGVVAISPYYFKLDETTVYSYYASIAGSTDLPILIYNFPDRTAVNLEPELVLRLAAAFPNIVGIKDTVDNISHTRKLIQTVKSVRPEFTVFSGFDEYLVPNLMAGGDGVICGLTNVAPEVFAGLQKAYAARDFDGVLDAQAKINILMNLYEVSQPFVAAIKGAVMLQGVPVTAAAKEPSIELTTQQLNRIREILTMAKVI